MRQIITLSRTTWHALKHRPDQLAHPLRRRAELARLKKLPTPRSVLILCLGNICRSPYASASLRRRLNGRGMQDVEVRSGGFIGAGRPPPPYAIEAAGRRSVDLAAHRSKLITESLVREAEWIIVMEPAHERGLRLRFPLGTRAVVVLGDLDPEPIETRAIRDPLDQGLEVFQDTYARIHSCIDELATIIEGPPSSRG